MKVFQKIIVLTILATFVLLWQNAYSAIKADKNYDFAFSDEDVFKLVTPHQSASDFEVVKISYSYSERREIKKLSALVKNLIVSKLLFFSKPSFVLNLISNCWTKGDFCIVHCLFLI